MERNQCPYCKHVPALSYKSRVSATRKPMLCQACGGPLKIAYSSKKDKLIFALGAALILGPQFGFRLWARITHTPISSLENYLDFYAGIIQVAAILLLPAVAGRVAPWRSSSLPLVNQGNSGCPPDLPPRRA